MTEIILGGIAAIATIIAAVIKYRELKTQEEYKAKSQELSIARETETALVNTMITRIDKLEHRQDDLQDKIREVSREATEERERLIKSYEEKIESIRKEMRRLIDDSNLELATWRDRYFTLMEEYHKLKMEYDELNVKFHKIDVEVKNLRATFLKRRKEDTDIIESDEIME